jgi:hypothetical protein
MIAQEAKLSTAKKFGLRKTSVSIQVRRER